MTCGACCCIILILLLSIPAIIGAWCWPTLVLGLLNIGESAIAWQLGHSITMILTLLLVISFWLYLFLKRNTRKGKYKYFPLYFGTAALVLVPIIPCWKSFADYHWVSLDSIWYHGCDADNAFFQFNCLSPAGWVVTILGTWVGNICLAVAMFWHMDFIAKL